MGKLALHNDFAGYVTVQLDREGRFMHGGAAVPDAQVPKALAERLAVPEETTDIFVFVHGWQHHQRSASRLASRLFGTLVQTADRRRALYPALGGFTPAFVLVHWPSRSSPFGSGYRRIRDRAHAMATKGDAASVLGAMLGYLDVMRQRPEATSGTLQTANGTFLHCVGHSFGCRLLGEAIMTAAEPPSGQTLGWPWDLDFPFAVDTFLGLQMAAAPDIFDSRFGPLVSGDAPIKGPVVLTFSPHDRALSTWHRLAEGRPGLGAVGVDGWRTIRLRRPDREYRADEFEKLTNVDCSSQYRRPCNVVNGAHSAYLHEDTVHLMLSLASLSRGNV